MDSKIVAKLVGKIKASPALIEWLSSHHDYDADRITVVNANLAVKASDRSPYGSSGGVGYWSVVTVFYKGGTAEREWNYRDRYSAAYDRWDLAVHGIGKVAVRKIGGQAVVTVVLLNRQHGNRTAEFKVTPVQYVPEIPSGDQEKFLVAFAAAKAQVMARKMELWKLKPPMLTSRGKAGYSQPRMQEEVLPKYGRGAFVVEEQIDHKVTGPQMRHELYLLETGHELRLVAEDHGYDSDGGAMVRLIELGPTSGRYQTKGGSHSF